MVGRNQQLIQPGALYSMLYDWHGCGMKSDSINAFLKISRTDLLPANTTSAVVSKCRSEDSDYFAIQTHAWKYISGPVNHLYVKPDDYWEFNDVADLCPRVSDGLKQQLRFAVEALRLGNRPEFSLPDELAFGVE